MWKTETPEPQPERSLIEREHVRLSVGEGANGPQRWQYFSMSFGAYTDRVHNDCLKTWPREAVRLAREKLDKFEAQLDEES